MESRQFAIELGDAVVQKAEAVVPEVLGQTERQLAAQIPVAGSDLGALKTVGRREVKSRKKVGKGDAFVQLACAIGGPGRIIGRGMLISVAHGLGQVENLARAQGG